MKARLRVSMKQSRIIFQPCHSDAPLIVYIDVKSPYAFIALKPRHWRRNWVWISARCCQPISMRLPADMPGLWRIPALPISGFMKRASKYLNAVYPAFGGANSENIAVACTVCAEAGIEARGFDDYHAAQGAPCMMICKSSSTPMAFMACRPMCLAMIFYLAASIYLMCAGI